MEPKPGPTSPTRQGEEKKERKKKQVWIPRRRERKEE
jgi:hypothetical protein